MQDSTAYRTWETIRHYFFPSEGEMLVYETLPFISYAVDQNGVFLWYNTKCRETLLLPPAPNGVASIRQFYDSERERERLLKEHRRMPFGKWLENSILDFNIDGKHWYLKDFSRMVADSTGQEIGIFSIMLPATQQERFQMLLGELPIGIFRFTRDRGGLDYANEKFLQMHGYDNLDQVKGFPVKSFIVDPEEATRMIEDVRENGRLRSRHVKLQKHDRRVFWGSIHAMAITDQEGNYNGTEGTIVDITLEGIYHELFHLVPIGLYKIEVNDRGEHIIVHCNDTFAKNLGFKSHEDLINRDIRPFHGTREEFDSFYERMLELERKHIFHEPLIVKRINENGEPLEFQVYTHIERDHSGNIVGRVGAQRDVTKERVLEKRIQEIRSDIGQVLHAYSTTLVMAKTNFDTVLTALTSGREGYFDGDIFHEGAALEHVDAAVKSVRSLARRLAKDLGYQNQNLSVFTEIERLAALLNEVSDLEMANLSTSQNYEVAIRLNDMFADDSFLKQQSKEKTRPIKQALEELIRNTSIIFLHRGLEGVLEMEAPVQTLRGFLVDGVKQKEDISRVDIYEVLLSVIKDLQSYAASRGIEIKYNFREIQNVYLSGQEWELKRAFINLLHNAVKYSWTRKTGTAPFVEITARKELARLAITIVNRGVGISRHEIEQGRIFQLGYRGEKSGDRRRPGTGIGLYDSKQVMEAHKGELLIDSRPVSGNQELDTPNQPYFTTVTCRIPFNPS